MEQAESSELNSTDQNAINNAHYKRTSQHTNEPTSNISTNANNTNNNNADVSGSNSQLAGYQRNLLNEFINQSSSFIAFFRNPPLDPPGTEEDAPGSPDSNMVNVNNSYSQVDGYGFEVSRNRLIELWNELESILTKIKQSLSQNNNDEGDQADSQQSSSSIAAIEKWQSQLDKLVRDDLREIDHFDELDDAFAEIAVNLLTTVKRSIGDAPFKNASKSDLSNTTNTVNAVNSPVNNVLGGSFATNPALPSGLLMNSGQKIQLFPNSDSKLDSILFKKRMQLEEDESGKQAAHLPPINYASKPKVSERPDLEERLKLLDRLNRERKAKREDETDIDNDNINNINNDNTENEDNEQPRSNFVKQYNDNNNNEQPRSNLFKNNDEGALGTIPEPVLDPLMRFSAVIPEPLPPPLSKLSIASSTGSEGRSSQADQQQQSGAVDPLLLKLKNLSDKSKQQQRKREDSNPMTFNASSFNNNSNLPAPIVNETNTNNINPSATEENNANDEFQLPVEILLNNLTNCLKQNHTKPLIASFDELSRIYVKFLGTVTNFLKSTNYSLSNDGTNSMGFASHNTGKAISPEEAKALPLVMLIPLNNINQWKVLVLDNTGTSNDGSSNAPYQLGRQPNNTNTANSNTTTNTSNADNRFLGFPNQVVSRFHLDIFYENGGQFFIRDVGSNSGTFLNGSRLSPAGKESESFQITSGDFIQLGVDYKDGSDPKHKRLQMIVITKPANFDKPTLTKRNATSIFNNNNANNVNLNNANSSSLNNLNTAGSINSIADAELASSAAGSSANAVTQELEERKRQIERRLMEQQKKLHDQMKSTFPTPTKEKSSLGNNIEESTTGTRDQPAEVNSSANVPTTNSTNNTPSANATPSSTLPKKLNLSGAAMNIPMAGLLPPGQNNPSLRHLSKSANNSSIISSSSSPGREGDGIASAGSVSPPVPLPASNTPRNNAASSSSQAININTNVTNGTNNNNNLSMSYNFRLLEGKPKLHFINVPSSLFESAGNANSSSSNTSKGNLSKSASNNQLVANFSFTGRIVLSSSSSSSSSDSGKREQQLIAEFSNWNPYHPKKSLVNISVPSSSGETGKSSLVNAFQIVPNISANTSNSNANANNNITSYSLMQNINGEMNKCAEFSRDSELRWVIKPTIAMPVQFQECMLVNQAVASPIKGNNANANMSAIAQAIKNRPSNAPPNNNNNNNNSNSNTSNTSNKDVLLLDATVNSTTTNSTSKVSKMNPVFSVAGDPTIGNFIYVLRVPNFSREQKLTGQCVSFTNSNSGGGVKENVYQIELDDIGYSEILLMVTMFIIAASATSTR